MNKKFSNNIYTNNIPDPSIKYITDEISASGEDDERK